MRRSCPMRNAPWEAFSGLRFGTSLQFCWMWQRCSFRSDHDSFQFLTSDHLPGKSTHLWQCHRLLRFSTRDQGLLSNQYTAHRFPALILKTSCSILIGNYLENTCCGDENLTPRRKVVKKLHFFPALCFCPLAWGFLRWLQTIDATQ